MNKLDFSDSAYALAVKLFSSISVLSTWIFGININIYQFLADHNLMVEYFYFGAAGQVVYTLMLLKGKLDSEEVIVKFSIRSLFALVIGWIVAPVLSLLIVSAFSSTYSLTFGILAFGLGASLEKAWEYIKRYTSKQIEDKMDLNN